MMNQKVLFQIILIDLLEYGEENGVEFIYTYINGEWMVTNKDEVTKNYKPFTSLRTFFDGRPFDR